MVRALESEDDVSTNAHTYTHCLRSLGKTREVQLQTNLPNWHPKYSCKNKRTPDHDNPVLNGCPVKLYDSLPREYMEHFFID